MHQPFKIAASLGIEKNGTCFLNPKRIQLLKRIDAEGSILAASKEMKMSYQQAWAIVKEINAIASLPVVIQQRGGANGGGAVITRFGFTLIERFEEIAAVHNKFISELEENRFSCFF